MPICKNIVINEQCRLVLWHVTESLDELLQLVTLGEQEFAKLDSFGSISRKKEYVTTRCLVREIVGENAKIENDEQGKPYLSDADVNISITHTKSYVGILLGKDHEVALDMEYLSDRVNRIATRFLSKEELDNIDKHDKTLHMYQHWCAKECLIKLYGKKDVHLIDELKIFPFAPNDISFKGQVCRDDFSKSYTFLYLQLDNHLLVYCYK